MKERRDVFYSGTVQGVGFRFATLRAAKGSSVTGFVRNEPDGRVRVVVEGNSDEIDGFLLTLEREMANFVRDVKCDRLPATGQFKSFDIRY